MDASTLSTFICSIFHGDSCHCTCTIFHGARLYLYLNYISWCTAVPKMWKDRIYSYRAPQYSALLTTLYLSFFSWCKTEPVPVMYSIMYSCIFNIFYGVLEVWKTVFKIKYTAWGICTRILLHNSVPVLYSMVYVHLYHPYYIPWCTAVPEVWKTVFKIESTAGRLCTRTLLHNFTPVRKKI